MKKFLKILTAAAVLLCGLAFTGCGAVETIKETVLETVNDSYNQWYKYKSKRDRDKKPENYEQKMACSLAKK